jgi:signal peptidase
MHLTVRLAGRIVLSAAACLVLCLLLALLVIPKLMGWVPLTVLSGSMRPTLQPGAEIVVKPVTTDDQLQAIRVGDVITFLPYPDDPTLVTHRVVGVAHRSDGTMSFTTQGDANGAADPDAVQGKQVRGILLYHVPLVGYLTTLVPSGGKDVAITVVAVALLLYGAWQFAGSVRSRRRAGRHRIPAGPDRTDPAEQRVSG